MEGFRNVTEFPVRFSDLDAMGHLNNARYITYFEEGRAAWFRECVGMPAESTAYPVIVARIEIDYLAPVAPGQWVRVYTRCSRIGNKSITIEGQINACAGPDATEETPAGRYVCTVVYFDYETGKTYPVPEEHRRKIEAFEEQL